jgi:hypothetical protein
MPPTVLPTTLPSETHSRFLPLATDSQSPPITLHLLPPQSSSGPIKLLPRKAPLALGVLARAEPVEGEIEDEGEEDERSDEVRVGVGGKEVIRRGGAVAFHSELVKGKVR